MKILDKEVSFSFTEAGNLEKLENAIEKAQTDIKKINTNNKTSIVVIETYKIIEECFDAIFNKGFSKEIFNNKKDFKLCIRAFNDLVRAKNEQDMEFDAEINSLQENINLANSRYSSNRATRRTKK